MKRCAPLLFLGVSILLEVSASNGVLKPGCAEWSEWGECIPVHCSQYRQRMCTGSPQEEEDDNDDVELGGALNTTSLWFTNQTRNCSCDIGGPMQEDASAFESSPDEEEEVESSQEPENSEPPEDPLEIRNDAPAISPPVKTDVDSPVPPAFNPLQSPIPAPCTPVSVQRDATYCIAGSICSGPSSNAPAGTACPKRGDTAVANCLNTLSSWKGNGVCVAPADASCAQLQSGAWGCAFDTPATGGCEWTEWTPCHCEDGEQKRTLACDGEDADDVERAQTKPCSCGAISYEGSNVLGEAFQMKLNKQNVAEELRKWGGVRAALVSFDAVPEPQPAGRRQLLESDPCSYAFSGAVPVLDAASNGYGQWVVSVLSETGGVFIICLQAEDGTTGSYPGSLVINGPAGVAVDGESCSATSAPMSIPSNTGVDIEIRGVGLNEADAWGLVQENEDCPPQQLKEVIIGGELGRAGSTAVLIRSIPDRVANPGVGPIHLCYRYAGTWHKLATCARSAALDTTRSLATNETDQATSASNRPWIIVGVVSAVLTVAAFASVWGYKSYRSHKRSRMETMFDIVPNPNAGHDSQTLDITAAHSANPTPGVRTMSASNSSGERRLSPNPLLPKSSRPTSSPLRLLPDSRKGEDSVVRSIRSSPTRLQSPMDSPSSQLFPEGEEAKDRTTEAGLSPVTGQTPFTPSGVARRRLHPSEPGTNADSEL